MITAANFQVQGSLVEKLCKTDLALPFTRESWNIPEVKETHRND